MSVAAPPKTKATWIVSRGGADIYWRCQMPAQHLDAKLILVPEDKSRCYTHPNMKGPFRWKETKKGASYPDIEGTVVWTRPCMVRATHGAAMTANGHRVICEVDDNYLSPPSQNIFMRMHKYGPAGRLSHMQAFASMDAIITSTSWLRDEYAKTFKKELRYVPDMFVARNHIDPETWEGREPLLPPGNGRVRVGWAGSHQHIWDLRLAAPTLHLAKQMGAEVVLIGLDPADHDPNWRTFLGDYTHVPWCDPDDYHKKYLNLDIGLAPLVYNRHTSGKSDIKFLEYAMSGAATVAQNVGVYNKTIRHGETGFLAGSPDEMALLTASLIRDKKLRNTLASNAKQFTLEERTIQGNLSEWEDAIVG